MPRSVADLTKIAKGIKHVMVMDDRVFRRRSYEGFSSGSRMLNITLTGRPAVGYVRGRIYEVKGPEGSGKSTLALHLVAEAQRAGADAALVDAEHALDPVYAAAIGVDLDRLLLCQPECGEDALAATEALVLKGIEVVVVDSVAALVPRAEIEGEMGDAHVGLQARLMSQALRKLSPKVGKHKTVLMFLNQIRFKIGVTYGSPETTPGGAALPFYAGVRMDVRSPRGGKILASGTAKKMIGKSSTMEDSEQGTHLVVKTIKNRIYPPFKKASLCILYGKGIDKTRDLLAVALHAGVVTELSDKKFTYLGKERSVERVNAALLRGIRDKTKRALRRHQ